MRIIILLAALAAGCGSKSDGGSSATAFPEMTSLSVLPLCGTAPNCLIAIKAFYKDGTDTVKDPFNFVVKIAALTKDPGACDGTSQKVSDNHSSVILNDVPHGSIYGIRACLFDGKTYSEGQAEMVSVPP